MKVYLSKFSFQFPLQIVFVDEETVAKMEHKKACSCNYVAEIGASASTKLPHIIIRKKIWDEANQIEREAICFHEALHIFLGHYFASKSLSPKKADKLVEERMPTWAKRALKRLRKRLKHKKICPVKHL